MKVIQESPLLLEFTEIPGAKDESLVVNISPVDDKNSLYKKVVRKLVDKINTVYQYREHDYGGPAGESRMRVRRSDWAGDVFQVFEYEEFQAFMKIANYLGIQTENLDITEPG